MQVSEQLLMIIRRVAMSLLLSVIALLLFADMSHAQNAGTVGIAAEAVPVFTNSDFASVGTMTSGGSWQCGVSKGYCPFLPDIGQGANLLTYCTTTYNGSIQLEWSFSGKAPFTPIAHASFGDDTGCHSLPFGSYFPNIRVSVTFIGGSLKAWYSANSGPVQFGAAAIGTNGPTPPVSCDQNFVATISNGTSNLIASLSNPTSDSIVICSMSVSFVAAPNGTVQVGWGAFIDCHSLPGNPTWAVNVLSASPNPFFVPMKQQVNPGVGQIPCFTNNSGQTAIVSTSYASILAP